MAVKTFVVGEVLTSDATNTYLANSGLVYVKSQTIGSGVTSISVTDAFSATYDNYLIVFSTVFSAQASRIFMRGTNSTSTTYAGSFIYMDNTSATVFGAQAGSSAYFDTGLSSSTGRTDVTVNFFNIWQSGIATRMQAQASGNTYGTSGWGRDSATNSSTDLVIAPAGGTMTGGTITVYGYRKA